MTHNAFRKTLFMDLLPTATLMFAPQSSATPSFVRSPDELLVLLFLAFIAAGACFSVVVTVYGKLARPASRKRRRNRERSKVAAAGGLRTCPRRRATRRRQTADHKPRPVRRAPPRRRQGGAEDSAA